MSEDRNLFLPLFYNTLEITESLSDAEFGVLVRELLRSRGKKEYAPRLPQNLILAYRFMMENATRVFGSWRFKNSGYRNSGGKKENSAPREMGFDPEEAFEKALERTYGNNH